MGLEFADLKATVEGLKEFNPMLGHRGCRLAVTYPEIAEMQARAIMEAAVACNKDGLNVVPEIMIPLVGDIKELKYVKDVVCKTADAIIEEAGVELPYKVGTMIEIPRAALTADEIAKEAEFFSFGTNDLTQMTYGFSRDDAAKFLNEYYTKNIFESDPFAHIDENGNAVKPETENGFKFETLVLDMVHMMDNCLAYEVVREKEFAPIKNKTGVDSVESARELLKLNGVTL